MTSPTSTNRFEFDDPSQDELDALLRRWHDVNAARAAAGREALMKRLANAQHADSLSLSEGEGPRKVGEGAVAQPSQTPTFHPHPRPLPQGRGERVFTIRVLSNVLRHRYFRAAASLALLAGLAALLMPLSNSPAQAQQIMLPDGGKLEAFDNRGNLIGPCALKHTDVHVDIAGPFSRVTLKQQYHNPYDRKIEAVYTFPLSNRGAVDRMTMTIGDRIIEAEMKERQQARQMYESARQAGHVASLLEQERPNIFTQSVANIEPKAEVLIEISYVEMLQSKDGEYTFDFPMVVAPRYVPGYALNRGWEWGDAQPQRLPNELERRVGVILRGPASFERLKVEMNGRPGEPNFSFNIMPDPAGGPIAHVQRIIDAAIPILQPDPAYRARQEIQDLLHSHPGINFNAIYADGTKEMGQIAADGLGHIAGRWFYFEPGLLQRAEREIIQRGAAFNSDTTQVPDGSRISPAPVRPPTRAGHDISLSVSIDTGGPAIIDYQSDLHQIVCTDGPRYRNLGNKINLALKNQNEIPNRDFVLHFRTMADQIQESTFAYMPQQPVDDKGGYFTVIVAPPQRVDDDAVTPRELIFVLDTSGSMSGQPIEKAKAVMARAIDSMRPRDTFNIITFSGDTNILWDRPRPNTPANRTEAQGFLASRAGNGGTEMMNAINAALAPAALPGQAARPLTPEQLANLPADGRQVVVRAPFDSIEAEVRKNAFMQPRLRVRPDLAISLTSFNLPMQYIGIGPELDFQGTWMTANGDRVLQLSSVQIAMENPQPLRIVMFLTDGQVGNDEAIIQAVKDNARTTRVFSFGIGDSPNRNLLDGIARAGRGEVEYVNLQSNPDAAVQRFAKRIGTPVLTDIKLAFAGQGVQVTDTIPPLDAVPDLFDVKPLIVHGRYATPLGVEAHSQLTIRGTTGAGPYERTIDLDLAPQENKHSMIATLWARASVDQLMNRDLAAVQMGNPAPDVKQQIIALGERYKIMTQYTSFVAVEKARMTIAGQPMLVPVPIELPEGMEWEGVFGLEGIGRDQLIEHVRAEGVNAALRDIRGLQMASRFDDAMQMIDAILVVDNNNPAALALRDTIQAGKMYRNYSETQRQMEWGYAHTNLGKSLVLPGVRSASTATNYFAAQDGATDFSWQRGQSRGNEAIFGATSQVDVHRNPFVLPEQSTTGLMTYPTDWPQLSFRRSGGASIEVGQGYAPIGMTQNNSSMIDNLAAFDVGSFAAVATGAPDVSGDGVVNTGDLLGIVNNWAPKEGAGATPKSSYGIALQQPEFKNAPTLDLDNALNEGRATQEQLEASKAASVGREESQRREAAERDRKIDEDLNRVHQLLIENKKTEALQVIDEILFVDERNQAAIALRDAIQANDQWSYVNLTVLMRLMSTHIPVDFQLNTLTQVIAFLEQVAGVEIRADWSALAQAGISKDAAITFKTQDADVVTLLDRVLDAVKTSSARPVFSLDQGAVRIVVPAQDGQSYVRTYDVEGFLKGSFAAAESTSVPALSRHEMTTQIVDILQENIDPESWRGLGGHTSDIQTIDDRFVITTTDRNHKQIESLLAQMRETAGISTPQKPPVETEAEKANRELAIAQAKREARLRRIIDQRLWPEVFTDETLGVEHRKAAEAAKQPEYKSANKAEGFAAGRNVAEAQSPLMVIILVREATERTIGELKSAGLNVQDIAASTKLVAGDIEPGKLAGLALVESVRRIEPVER